MADLESKLQIKVDSFIDEAYEFFQKKEYDKSFDLYKKAFEVIPEPKENFGESFNIFKYMLEDYLKIGQPLQAMKIIPNLEKYYSLRYDAGEIEFLKGKTYFELSHFNEALKHFKIAFDKSKGREFEGEDPKYKDFYLNPERYMNN